MPLLHCADVHSVPLASSHLPSEIFDNWIQSPERHLGFDLLRLENRLIACEAARAITKVSTWQRLSPAPLSAITGSLNCTLRTRLPWILDWHCLCVLSLVGTCAAVARRQLTRSLLLLPFLYCCLLFCLLFVCVCMCVCVCVCLSVILFLFCFERNTYEKCAVSWTSSLCRRHIDTHLRSLPMCLSWKKATITVHRLRSLCHWPTSPHCLILYHLPKM